MKLYLLIAALAAPPSLNELSLRLLDGPFTPVVTSDWFDSGLARAFCYQIDRHHLWDALCPSYAQCYFQDHDRAARLQVVVNIAYDEWQRRKEVTETLVWLGVIK